MSNSAKSTRKNVEKYRNAGLRQIKVWVTDETIAPDYIVTEADRIRAYAAKLPKTKAILKDLTK